MHGLWNKFQDCCPCWHSRHLNHRRVTNLFLMYYFLLDEGPTLETLDFTIRIANLFIFRLQVKYIAISYHCGARPTMDTSLIWFNLMPTKQWSHVEVDNEIVMYFLLKVRGDPGSLNPSRLKRDNFYHINTPSRFARTILCWLWKLSRVKSSLVETFSCKPGMKSVPSRLP